MAAFLNPHPQTHHPHLFGIMLVTYDSYTAYVMWSSKMKWNSHPKCHTLVILRVFPKHILWRGVVATPFQIINTVRHKNLNLLPVYRYGHPLSIDTKISTNH